MGDALPGIDDHERIHLFAVTVYVDLRIAESPSTAEDIGDWFWSARLDGALAAIE